MKCKHNAIKFIIGWRGGGGGVQMDVAGSIRKDPREITEIQPKNEEQIQKQKFTR